MERRPARAVSGSTPGQARGHAAQRLTRSSIGSTSRSAAKPRSDLQSSMSARREADRFARPGEPVEPEQPIPAGGNRRRRRRGGTAMAPEFGHDADAVLDRAVRAEAPIAWV